MGGHSAPGLVQESQTPSAQASGDGQSLPVTHGWHRLPTQAWPVGHSAAVVQPSHPPSARQTSPASQVAPGPQAPHPASGWHTPGAHWLLAVQGWQAPSRHTWPAAHGRAAEHAAQKPASRSHTWPLGQSFPVQGGAQSALTHWLGGVHSKLPVQPRQVPSTHTWPCRHWLDRVQVPHLQSRQPSPVPHWLALVQLQPPSTS